MKFFCLCMSPAIDALVKLPAAPKGDGEIFKDVADEENVGGKTINVARWLARRSRVGSLVSPAAHSLPDPSRPYCGRVGSLVSPAAHSLPDPEVSVVCGGLLGEDNAAIFEKELAKFGIEDRFLRVPGATRRNEMVTWSGGAFKVNRAAFPNVPAIRVEDVLAGADGADVAILSGSLPKCCAPSFYAECIRILKARGIIVVLDASGEALRLGVAAGPDVIKPNAEECEPLVGFVPKTPDEFRRATELLKAVSQGEPSRDSWAHFAEMRHEETVAKSPRGAFRRNAPTGDREATVIISDGGAGAWFNGEFVPAPEVEVVDTTAAGDTLLAEWCWRQFGDFTESESDIDGRVRGLPAAAACWAVAAGSAACTMPGSQPPSAETVERLKLAACEVARKLKSGVDLSKIGTKEAGR